MVLNVESGAELADMTMLMFPAVSFLDIIATSLQCNLWIAAERRSKSNAAPTAREHMMAQTRSRSHGLWAHGHFDLFRPVEVTSLCTGTEAMPEQLGQQKRECSRSKKHSQCEERRGCAPKPNPPSALFQETDIWSRAPRPPPLPPPPWSMVQDALPPVGWSVGSLFPLWGGCGAFGVLGLA